MAEPPIIPVPCTTAGCGTLIFFALTGTGKQMPVDYDSPGRAGGTLAVARRGGQVHCRVLKSPGDLAAGEVLGTSHYVTCTRPAEHRRPR